MPFIMKLLLLFTFLFLPNASYGTKLNPKPIICPSLPLHFTPKEEHVFPLVALEYLVCVCVCVCVYVKELTSCFHNCSVNHVTSSYSRQQVF
jgi:hypothetical protein